MKNNMYTKFDSCYGIVTDKCHNGVYLLLDNNQIAYVYGFCTLVVGTKVVCTIVKEATEKLRTLALIDSVISEKEMLIA